MKTSALRRWLVILGLIARDQTTRFTGGYDFNFVGAALEALARNLRFPNVGAALCRPLYNPEHIYIG